MHVVTSEAVADGHPDKVADQISDAIVDAALTKYRYAKVAAEVLVTRDYCLIAGEVSGAKLDYELIARRVVADLGYTKRGSGFCASTMQVDVRVQEQDAGVAGGLKTGANDQGIMYGYACNDTAELMPAPLMYSRRILQGLAQSRHAGLGSDAKAQVSVQYRNGAPVHVPVIVVSQQHDKSVKLKDLRVLVELTIKNSIPGSYLSAATQVHVNPGTGLFLGGGPAADTGLTGRKIIVDTYGGVGRHGGGAFSGKDPSKVDRSAAYMARYIAKNVVAAGLADRCEIQLAYGFGLPTALSFRCNTFGTGTVSTKVLEAAIKAEVSFEPWSIIERLHLREPHYQRAAAWGHFGYSRADRDFPWERTDLASALRNAVG